MDEDIKRLLGVVLKILPCWFFLVLNCSTAHQNGLSFVMVKNLYSCAKRMNSAFRVECKGKGQTHHVHARTHVAMQLGMHDCVSMYMNILQTRMRGCMQTTEALMHAHAQTCNLRVCMRTCMRIGMCMRRCLGTCSRVCACALM